MVTSGLVRVMDDQSLRTLEQQQGRRTARGADAGGGGCGGGADGGGCHDEHGDHRHGERVGGRGRDGASDESAAAKRKRDDEASDQLHTDVKGARLQPDDSHPRAADRSGGGGHVVGGHGLAKEETGLKEVATSPPTATSGLSTLYITSDVDGWSQASRHADHNGLLVKRPFHGEWDVYQADIDACHERVDLGNTGLFARVTFQGTSSEHLELEAVIGGLLRQAALPAPLSKQILRDACSIGRAVASMCSWTRALDVQLEVAGENVCSRWHQDNFGGRALTCYTGVVGTEYTADENVNFWELNNCGNNDHILHDPNQVETIGIGDILFIQGKTYGGSKPLVHRSPAKRYHADGRILNRLLLKIDVPARSDGV
jgi:hypothetical protein